MHGRTQRLALSMTLLALLATPIADAFGSDPLSSLRHEVRTEVPREPRPSREPAPPARSSHSCRDEDSADDSALVGLGLLGLGVAVTSPWWVPVTLVEDRHPGIATFAAAPYEDAPGAMVYDSPVPTFDWATHLRLEYLDDFDAMTAYRGQLRVEHVNRWGFDTELNYWRESLAPGVRDHLWTGDANLLFRFAQNERMQMRTGLGLAWLADDDDLNLGVNFTYGADIYPIRPLVFTAELDAGWIGEAWMIHLRTTGGIVYRQVEVYAGYDYLEIGQAQLDGVIAGVRILF